MPSSRQPLVIGPFAGGLNTYDDPTAVRDTELVEALNWDPGLEGSLRSRPPFTDVNMPMILGPTGNAKFLGFFYSPSGATYLIASDGDSSTWAYDGATWTLITSTFSASAMTQFDNKAWLLAPVGEADPGGWWVPGSGFTADADMPRGETIVGFKSRLWVSPGKGNPNGTRVYYSKVLGQPNFWTTPSFIDVGQGDGQEIVLLTTYYNTLVAFRSQSIYNFSFTSDPAQGSVNLLVPNVGLASKDCLISYENYLYFMYDEKAYQFVNNNASQINIKVPFTANNKANISIPYAVSLFNNRAIFHYFDTMYVYSLRTRTWTRWRSPKYGAIGQIMSPSGVLVDEAYVNPSAVQPEEKTYTNQATNPSFEVGSGTLELRRNMAINPVPSGTTGWSSYGGAAISEAGGEITVVCPGNASAEGAQVRSETDTAARPNVSGGMWVKAPAGTPLYIEIRANGNYAGRVTTNFNATGNWQFVKAENSGSATMDVNTHAVMVRTRAAVAVTFQLKQAIIELSPTLGSLFYGGYQEDPDPDLTAVWAGTPNNSASILQAVPVTGVSASTGTTFNFQSSQWSKTGTKSLRSMGKTTSSDAYASPGGDTGGMRLGMVAGKTYTVLVTCRLSAPLTGGDPNRARRVRVFYRIGTGSYQAMDSPQAPNVAGSTDIRYTFTLPAGTTEAFVRLYGAPAGAGSLWWDNFAIVEGAYDGPYFDGNTPDDRMDIYDWTGTANASTSTRKVLRGSPLLRIEDRVSTLSEEFQCVVQTKNYNYQNSSNFKRLFWWGVDAVFRTKLQGWAVPVVQRTTITWGQLRERGVTWGQLLNGTWGFPLQGASEISTEYDLEGAGPVRKFVKMFKSLRFRQIYFRLVFDTDGSIGTSPVNLFTITAYVSTKETVSKAVS